MNQAIALCVSLAAVTVADAPKTVRLGGEVVDAASGKPLPARIHIQGEDGAWHFPQSEAPEGSAIPYRRQRGDNKNAVEMHTTLSAHPFSLDLPPGTYTITVERGKEYLPLSRIVKLAAEPMKVTLPLQRWIDMAERGWYSGDTHVHRNLEELPQVMLAEDLNIALPLLYWVTEAFAAPKTSARSAVRDPEPKPIVVGARHLIYPRNTEYEIFTVNKKSHTLGALFVLNHKTVLEEGVPPVKPVAERARREGALLELDKHNWPWSMMLVPVLNVDLFELSNNHVWRTEFTFRTFGEREAEFMGVERDERGWSEWGWIDYGFQNYYTLLNCGFRVRPTAGTASGVHPVPLGFGRVYVHVDKHPLAYDDWIRGLDGGRSFVTTGPMLLIQVNEHDPGHIFKQANAEAQTFVVRGTALSAQPLERVEIVVNGELVQKLKPENRKRDQGGYESPIETKVKIEGTSWIAVRCFEERTDRRVRFAHTGPVHIEVPGKPLRPRKVEIDFLIKRVEDQIRRSGEVLPAAALEEYREGLKIYQEIAKTAR